jgi:DNA-binding response OmpR family regulator
MGGGDAGDGRRVLIVEDDAALAELVALALAKAGYQPTLRSDGDEGLRTALDGGFDVVLLDILLPGLDGVEVCRRLRARSQVPIIMITAKAETRDVVTGLDCGADDYLPKPFEVAELLARVRAVTRRGSSTPGPVIVHGDLEICPAEATVTKRGEQLALTATEFRLLLTLARAPRQVFSREALLREVWGYDYLGDSGMVTMAVKRLRDKVEDDPAAPSLIETVRGFGYRLSPP